MKDERWTEWTANRDGDWFAQELETFREALHNMARDYANGGRPPDYVFREEQAYVDYYIAQVRMKRD